MTITFIPPTKRRAMTKARAAKIFLSRNGICFTCRTQIRAGQQWFIEHPDPIAQGGSDDDADLWPAHMDCKAMKDAADAKTKAKRDRLVTASYRPDGERSSKWKQRPKVKAPPQRRASTPMSAKFSNLRRVE